MLAYDGVNAFELGLAVEVFGLTDMGTDWYRLVVCSEHPGRPLATNNGIRIVADDGLRTLALANTIIVPGWSHIEHIPSVTLLDTLRRAHQRGVRIASICSGVFILAAAGLLDGRRATAHWAQAELLSSRYPAVNVDPNVLYVDDGDIMSSAEFPEVLRPRSAASSRETFFQESLTDGPVLTGRFCEPSTTVVSVLPLES
ncbi:DJ-1/PfpI family protein [Bradyrhizobium sp. CCBAU 11361]|uniref:DJ-1/PfpI family protein n=1 Tax=Bradyrhizobium sp. CCBAU 11361 TaxID=1630812 RepID=UPI0023028BE0|nr:DJ-1/PfpI family protein [Bradyrhizobium sp. CCBAU 11361]